MKNIFKTFIQFLFCNWFLSWNFPCESVALAYGCCLIIAVNQRFASSYLHHSHLRHFGFSFSDYITCTRGSAVQPFCNSSLRCSGNQQIHSGNKDKWTLRHLVAARLTEGQPESDSPLWNLENVDYVSTLQMSLEAGLCLSRQHRNIFLFECQEARHIESAL